jgi:citrate synthase
VPRRKQIVRLIGKMPTLAAYAYRHRLGLPYIYPDPDLGYTKNYMNMLWKRTEPKYAANPVLARALEVLFILHADHEQNCSTSAMRAVGSSARRPVRHHGGGHRRALRPAARRRQRGSAAHAGRDRLQGQHPGLHQQVKDGKRKLMGFGHRVYKNYDPRARIIKQVAEEVFEVTGRNPKIDIALELEKIASPTSTSSSASSTPTWISTRASSTRPWASRRTSSPCCSAFRAPSAGWRSGRKCCRTRQKIARPRQVYTGRGARDFVPPRVSPAPSSWPTATP